MFVVVFVRFLYMHYGVNTVYPSTDMVHLLE